MKLFGSPTSPFVRKVTVLLHEVGLQDQVEVVHTNPFDADPELVAANPASQVPTLITPAFEPELSLFDSRVICEFLDGKHEQTCFFPPSGAARFKALRTQSLADTVMGATVSLRLEHLRPEAQRSPEHIARWLRTVRNSLTVLAQELPELPAEPTIAHIAQGCALAYLDLRLSAEPWRNNHEGLARWYGVWANRPSMRATAFPGA